MNFRSGLAFIVMVLLFGTCDQVDVSSVEVFPSPKADHPQSNVKPWDEGLTMEIFEDKVLGMIVGSAIGDAMGAPTEMWHRDEIQIQWGYVNRLDKVVREGSPEGPWDYNLPAGGTTDDTRWKYLFEKFMAKYPTTPDQLNAKDFAQYVTDLYLQEKAEIKEVDEFLPDELETQVRHMTWLQEWAKVAKPYLEDDIDAYTYAVSKFYGGEMSCAGMLYAPMVGLYYPGDPERAYEESYRLSIYDLGFARDISSLTAAYVSRAMQSNATMNDIMEVSREVDPNGYFKSRLVGRISHRIHQDAKRIVSEALKVRLEGALEKVEVPINYPYDHHYYLKVSEAYRLLDEKLQDIPFHAAEIHLINLTALEFGNGDFKRTLEFVVNYGRDNDTVAAVTGAILGAMLGAGALPEDWSDQAISTNRDVVGIDLEELAGELVQVAYGGQR